MTPSTTALPPERVPFPVEPHYSVRPTMRRFGDDAGHLRLDRRFPEYLDAKLRLLRDDPDGCRVFAPRVDPSRLERVLVAAAEGLAVDAGRARAVATPAVATPTVATPTGGRALEAPVPVPVLTSEDVLRFPLLGLALRRSDLSLVEPEESAEDGRPSPALPGGLRERVRAHLAGLEPLARLADALALAVQEDLVVMAGGGAPDGGAPDGRAELLHVCFPSSWDPAERAGAGFRALHAPVPHGEVLAGAAERVVRAMVAKGPFVRYVWSLAPDGELDQNPRRRAPGGRRSGLPARRPAAVRVPGSPAELWFRVERQTVLPLPELGHALFTIRVYRAPLPAVLTSPERRTALASALRSMDAALLAYKGVRDRDALVDFVERGGQAGPAG